MNVVFAKSNTGNKKNYFTRGKNKHMKAKKSKTALRLLAFLLAFAMAFTSMPVMAYEAELPYNSEVSVSETPEYPAPEYGTPEYQTPETETPEYEVTDEPTYGYDVEDEPTYDYGDYAYVEYEYEAALAAALIDIAPLSALVTVGNLADLASAIATAPADGSLRTINVTASFAIANSIVVPAGRNVLITAATPVVLSKEAGNTQRHFTVRGTLTLGNNITLLGHRPTGFAWPAWTSVTLASANVIELSDTAWLAGGGVLVDAPDARFYMEVGSIIRGTRAGAGAGVQIRQGTFTMNNGAIIEDNLARGLGGGVGLTRAGGIAASTFIMNGGTIRNNVATSAGGGIGGDTSYDTPGAIRIYGGLVQGNATSNHGGGIRVTNHISFFLQDALISGNFAHGNGAGISFATLDVPGAPIVINGGTLSSNRNVGNPASSAGSISRYAMANLSGGSFDNLTLLGENCLRTEVGVLGSFTGTVRWSGGASISSYPRNGTISRDFATGVITAAFGAGDPVVLNTYTGESVTIPGSSTAVFDGSGTISVTHVGGAINVPSGSTVILDHTLRPLLVLGGGVYRSAAGGLYERDAVNPNIFIPHTPTFRVYNLTQLTAALAAVPTNGIESIITVAASFAIGNSRIVPEGANVVLRADAPVILSKSPGNTQRHFTVRGTLTLENNITLSGHRPAGFTWPTWNQTTLASANVTAHAADWSTGGGVVLDSPTARLYMNAGSTIRGNRGGTGGGVDVRQGTFTMNNGAIIENNFSTSYGGGVALSRSDIAASSTFIMNNGTIRNNVSSGAGGGVGSLAFYDTPGAIRIYGGLIQGNATSNHGGGIRIQNQVGFFLNNALIEGNFAHGNGAGISFATLDVPGAPIVLNGGTLSSNRNVGNPASSAASISRYVIENLSGGSVDNLILQGENCIRFEVGPIGATTITVMWAGGASLTIYPRSGTVSRDFATGAITAVLGSGVPVTMSTGAGESVVAPGSSTTVFNGSGMVSVTMTGGTRTVPNGSTVVADQNNRPLLEIGNGTYSSQAGGLYERSAANPAIFIPIGGGPILWGDVDDNGRVDMFDLMLLELFLSDRANPNFALANMAAADVDDNGRVDMFDLMLLELFLSDRANPNFILGPR